MERESLNTRWKEEETRTHADLQLRAVDQSQVHRKCLAALRGSTGTPLSVRGGPLEAAEC